MRYKTKKPRLFSRDYMVFEIHHHETVVSTLRLPLTQFHAGFVCNFLSSSVGINLCSCFSRLTLALCFRFRLSLGRPFHGLSPLPFRFLTSAVFAFFRPLQFWILTTQPLFLPFPSLPDSASQWLPQCSALAFAPAVFPVLSCLVSRAFLPGSWYSASLYVSFRPSLTRSHSCSSGAHFQLSLSVFSASLPLSFVHFCSASGYSASASSFLPSGSSPHSQLFVQARFLASPSLFPFIHGWFPVRFFRFRILSSLFVSFRPSLLRSHSRSTGASLSDFSSGIGA